MAGGVASALAAAARRGGRTLTGDFGLFEVDEFWLGPVVEELEPRAMLLGNLFRDQLDRYGELETIADRWAAVVAKTTAQLVLNADDPLVADLGRGRDAVYFGVDDDSLALPQLQHASDSKHCRRCGHAYAYEAIYLAHLGHYRCPNCGQERPAPTVTATDVRAARHPLGRVHAAGPARRAAAPRPLQRLQRARRRRAHAEPGRRRSTTSWPACRRWRPRSGARRRSTSAAAPPRSCWSRTRPGRTRCCARSRWRATGSTCSACSTTAPPTAATSPGCGTPTGSCSRPASAA